MRSGYATVSGTRSFAERRDAAVRTGFYRTAQGLTVSSLGIGTYLGDRDEAASQRYEDAIAAAVRGGINFIDTSLNYRHTASEKNIGAAIADLPREEIVVCTKAGYLVRGHTPDLEPADVAGGAHSMAPAFLRDQLDRSRANLNLETVDVLYLHNPETQLEHIPRDEFNMRLSNAFATLEQLRSEGRIQYYGAATWNGFRKPGVLSLDDMLRIAEQAGGASHGFRFIQLPFNMAMREALANRVMEDAASRGVTVVTSASMLQSRLVSLGAQLAIQFARSAAGVTVSLVGMGRREHVEENLGVAAVPPLTRGEFDSVLEKL